MERLVSLAILILVGIGLGANLAGIIAYILMIAELMT